MLNLQRREIHGEGQTHRKEREEPCWQRDGGKSDHPVQHAWNDMENDSKHP